MAQHLGLPAQPSDLAPRRVLAAGDWHGNRDWALNVVNRVPQLLPDEQTRLILHVGDFGIWPGVAGRRYLDSVSAVLDQVGAQLWFVDGNHEDFVQLAQMAAAIVPDGRIEIRPNIFHLPRGYRWEWHDLSWLACGGGVSLDKAGRTEGIDWWPQEEITSGQEAAVIAGGHADVMVCHDCPSAVTHTFPSPPSWWALVDLARNDAHRERLQRIVDAVRPAHLMHGHLHRAYQRTCDFGYGPVHITGLAADGSLRNFAVLDVESLTWKLRRRGLLDIGRHH
jgi:Calcineurin-like phosphoesterase